MDIEQITKIAKVIVPDNWDNNQKGQFWENLVADLLRQRGFHVIERIEFTGMEADCLAEHSETHQKAWVECKFKTKQKTTIESDVIMKLLGTAFRKEVTFAYLFSTSEPGSNARGVIHEENEKNKYQPDRKPKLVFVGPKEIVQWFIDFKGVTVPELNRNNIGIVKSLILIINPDKIFWVAEELKNNEVNRVIIFPVSKQKKINFNEILAEFSKLNLWQDQEIVDGTQINKQTPRKSNNIKIEQEKVTSIGCGEHFEHYQRPCKPEYFVGRKDLREKFLNFLQDVRDEKTSTRIVCFSGQSGLGKSSLVLKIEEDCSQAQYENNFYLYHVDVRAAKSAFFVISAIKAAIQKAIDDGFIELPNHTILIESLEQPLLYIKSIKTALDKLKSSRRVLVIFFDQFEEILTKEALFPLYELFENISHEVNSLKENIVLGFCWRTGITMPDGNPAYHLWHGLKDKRIEFEIKNFSRLESTKLLDQFDIYLNKLKNSRLLDNKAKDWLLEYCPGFPWLLRKILGDIYNHSLSKSEFCPKRQIDIKNLFEKDLEKYITTGEEVACLKYIAQSSPVSMHEVIDKFGNNIVKNIEDNRLIIRAGINYILYWDIFREYILEDKLPIIPVTYRPRYRINTVLDTFNIIIQQKTKEIALPELKKLSKSKDINSIILDLKNFDLIDVPENNIIKIKPLLVNSGYNEIANYLAKQLEEHIVTQELYTQVKPGKIITLWKFQEIVSKAFGNNDKNKKTTQKDYTSRMISWLLFAGLIEKQPNRLIIRPVGDGKQKGNPLDCTFAPLKDELEPPLLKLLNSN